MHPAVTRADIAFYLNSSPSVLAVTRSKAPVTRLHVHKPLQDPAPTHRELYSYSLAHRRSSIRHCQSTSSRPATEPRNARHQPCITIVAPSNPTQPTHRPLEQLIQQHQPYIRPYTRTSIDSNQPTAPQTS